MRTINTITLALLCSAAVAKKPPDAAMLTAQAVETALSAFFAVEQNADRLICRSIFTPGSSHIVGTKKIRVISRDEIADGNQVALVRIREVAIRETDSVPAQLTVVVKLVTWSEVGKSRLVPMHASLTYEMRLDENADLKVTKESRVLE